MKSPFASINTMVVGAAIFGIIIAVAIVVGSWYPTNTINTVNATNAVSLATTSVITATTTSTLSISILPKHIIEGDPVMITIVGTTGTADSLLSNIKNATLIAPGPNATDRNTAISLHFLNYKNIPTTFYGTGINQKTGTTTVGITFKNGSKLSVSFFIGARISQTENLAVPAQLGGNSTSSQKQLVTNLFKQNTILANTYSNPNISYWTSAFTWPIHAGDIPSTPTSPGGIVITDTFGYIRSSGTETIIHKGIDFKAPPGTPIYSVNAGYVRVAKLFSVYGNTIVVDHGLGIQSWYMHLSKMVVTPSEVVKQGQLIGYSGETGYTEGPHLHLSIRIDGVSIDPIKFYALFGLAPDSYSN